jgi:DUF4097 and DUF4098 domain-containing protein YvlB
MEKYAKQAVLIVAIVAMAGSLWSAQTVSESYPATSGSEVDLEILSGTVTIDAWGSDLVEITGTLGDGVKSLEVEVDEEGVYIEVEYDEDYHGRQKVDTELTIRVPEGVSLSVESVSASISVMGVTGAMDLESVSGSVDVGGRPARLDVETVSGNISIESAPPESDVASVSGLIEIRAAGGLIDVENVSGNIMIHGGIIDGGDLESVSGDITCHAVPGPGDDLDIGTMDGTITLSVDPSLVASFEISTFSGSIKNDLGPAPQRTSKYTPGLELSFNTGPGGPSISLESFSGSINLVTR